MDPYTKANVEAEYREAEELYKQDMKLYEKTVGKIVSGPPPSSIFGSRR